MATDTREFGDLTLMSDERVDSAFDLERGLAADGQDASEVILLTNKRVIHLNGHGERRRAVLVSLRNVDAVEITTEREGFGAFVWAGLAFVAAALVWVVWDSSLAPIGALVVAAMGVYLIVDRTLSPGNAYAVFSTGSSQLRFGIGSSLPSKDIYDFVNRLFQLQSEDASQRAPGAIRFPPR